MVASVHSESDELVGYFVVDRAVPGATWASYLAMPGLSVDDACLLARSTTSQLGFLLVPRGSAQCLYTGTGAGLPGAHSQAYFDALAPFVDDGRLQVVLEDTGSGPRPAAARAGLIASAVASTKTVLDRTERINGTRTVGQHLPTEISNDVAAALEQDGFHSFEGEAGLSAEVDVLVVGAPIWSLTSTDARLVRSKLLVSLGAARTSFDAEEILHERRVALLPDAVSAAGRFLALYLTEEGLAVEDAVARTAETAVERVCQAIDGAPDSPLAEATRSLAGTAAVDAA